MMKGVAVSRMYHPGCLNASRRERYKKKMLEKAQMQEKPKESKATKATKPAPKIKQIIDPCESCRWKTGGACVLPRCLKRVEQRRREELASAIRERKKAEMALALSEQPQSGSTDKETDS
jgi:hypothetical protein